MNGLETGEQDELYDLKFEVAELECKLAEALAEVEQLEKGIKWLERNSVLKNPAQTSIFDRATAAEAALAAMTRERDELAAEKAEAKRLAIVRHGNKGSASLLRWAMKILHEQYAELRTAYVAERMRRCELEARYGDHHYIAEFKETGHDG